MSCEKVVFGVCLNPASAGAGNAVFGFPEFLTAFALLLLVYNLSDARYRFRVQTAPIPLFPITFAVTTTVGIGTLLAELWFSHSWLAPAFGFNRVDIQTIFGASLLALVLIWTWFASVSPAKFGRWNDVRYVQAVYHFLLRGGPEQLEALSKEIPMSSKALVKYASLPASRTKTSLQRDTKNSRARPQTSLVARDVLALLPHRPFCRFLVAGSPTTAIVLLQDAAEAKLYGREVGQFAHQIANAAIENTDSILYHESGLFGGLIGDLKSFRMALFGDFALVDRPRHSALDLDWKFAGKMSAEQVGMYGECVLTTFRAFIKDGIPGTRPRSLSRAIQKLAEFTNGLYKLDQIKVSLNDESSKTFEVMQTLMAMIEALGEADSQWSKVGLRSPKNYYAESVYDAIAEALFEIVTHAGNIAGPMWTAWDMQHNTIWSPLTSNEFTRKNALGIVQFKLNRLIFDEIKKMVEMPNYRGARCLRFCLYVLAWNIDKRDIYPKSDFPLRKAVINWTRNNFQALHRASPDVAASCLNDMIEYNEPDGRLLRRHEKSIFRPERFDVLELVPFKAS